jgi:hypothetical protein
LLNVKGDPSLQQSFASFGLLQFRMTMNFWDHKRGNEAAPFAEDLSRGAEVGYFFLRI